MSLLAPNIKDLSSSNNNKTKCENRKNEYEKVNIRYKYKTEVTGGVASSCIPAQEYCSCLEAALGA